MRNANPITILSAQSGDASFTLPAAGQSLGGLKSGEVQLDWTGTLNGTISVFVSNDDVSYTALATTASPAGSAGSGRIPLGSVGFKYVQIDWNRTGGTGNITATIAGVE